MRGCRAALIVVTGALALGTLGQTTPPTAQEIRVQLAEVGLQLDRAQANPRGFLQKDKRAEMAATAVPLLKKRVALLEQLAKVSGGKAAPYDRWMIVHDMTMLACLGDEESRKAVEAASQSRNPEALYVGRLTAAFQQWLESAGDAAAQAKVLETLRPLVKANPMDDVLAHLLLAMKDTAATPENRDAAEALVFKELKGPRAVMHQQFPHIGRPYTVLALTATGRPFNSEKLKGKVIVFHIWHSGDPVCRVELTDLAKFLKDHKDEGLELVGVPCDDDAKALANYLAGNKDVTWPQLYDPKAPHALKARWGFQYNNEFLVIDRTGVVRLRQGREGLAEKLTELLAEKAESKPAEVKGSAKP